jgi:hypothetical protein
MCKIKTLLAAKVLAADVLSHYKLAIFIYGKFLEQQ